MASSDILLSSPLNLKHKITKIEHQKIFCGPLKSLKIFHGPSWPPQKPSGAPPKYFVYSSLLKKSLKENFIFLCRVLLILTFDAVPYYSIRCFYHASRWYMTTKNLIIPLIGYVWLMTWQTCHSSCHRILPDYVDLWCFSFHMWKM